MKLNLIHLALLLFVLAFVPMLGYAQDKSPPAVTSDTAKATTIPALSQDDFALLSPAIDELTKANKDIQTSQLFAEAANAKMQRAQAYLYGQQMRILAKHRLDPDVYKVDIATFKDKDGAERQEWRIQLIEKTKPPAPAPSVP